MAFDYALFQGKLLAALRTNNLPRETVTILSLNSLAHLPTLTLSRSEVQTGYFLAPMCGRALTFSLTFCVISNAVGARSGLRRDYEEAEVRCELLPGSGLRTIMVESVLV